MPAPVRAETTTHPRSFASSPLTSIGSAVSALLMTTISGTSAAPISASTWRTADICACGSAPLPSTTCRTRSAWATSSSVERNASTSWCGRRRTKPTVSVRVNQRPEGVRARRTEGSRVANSESSTRTPAPVSRLSRLDFPALVYPAMATAGTSRRRRCSRWTSRPTDIAAIWRRSLAVRARIRRRSVSILVSPGPRVPMPPPPAARLPGQRLAPAAQPRQQVLELRQFHLRLALLAAGVLREDVQDEGGAVDDLHLHHALQPSQLAGGELVVADDRVGAGRHHQGRQLGGLARTDVGRRVGPPAPLHQAIQHDRPGRLGEPGQLAQRVLRRGQRPLGPYADEHHALQPQRAVLDFGDVGEFGRQARDPAQGVPVGQIELAYLVLGGKSHRFLGSVSCRVQLLHAVMPGYFVHFNNSRGSRVVPGLDPAAVPGVLTQLMAGS